MRKTFILPICLFVATSIFSQNRWMTRNATIRFYSNAPLEKIEAVNQSGISIFDQQSGQIEFAVLLKGFVFEKALMQEHFNENYVESDRFPKAKFKGNIMDIAKVDFTKNGIYPVLIKGDLTLHGVTKFVSCTGQFNINNTKVDAFSEWKILLDDYHIKIPSLLNDKISKTVKITVNASYQIQ